MFNYVIGLVTVIVTIYLVKYINKNASSVTVKWIFYEIIYNCIIKFFVGILNLPSIFNYINDLILAILIFQFLKKLKNKRMNIEVSKYHAYIIIFFMVALISYFINLYSPFLLLWGIRNNFRFLIFGLICIEFIRKDDLKLLYPIISSYFVINIITVTYQYFCVTYHDNAIGDFISGLYSNGAVRGGNMSLCWLLCIGCTYSLINYLNKKIKLGTLLFWLLGSIYISALNETKIFFIELIIIILLGILLCKKSFKTMMLIILGIALIYQGINMLYYFTPKFANFFNAETILNYAENSYSNDGISRAGAIEYCLDNFLTDHISRFFGIGIGNADYSSFELFTSEFYQQYNLIGYTYFSSSMMVIEMGLFGVFVYILNMISILFKSILNKENKQENIIWKNISIITILLGIISFFANNSLRLESCAYMIHFIFVIPLILIKERDKGVK